MGRYGVPYHAMIVGIQGGLYLCYIMGRYRVPYHAMIVRIHGGLYLHYIMGRYGRGKSESRFGNAGGDGEIASYCFLKYADV
jgi:hypothetical protein